MALRSRTSRPRRGLPELFGALGVLALLGVGIGDFSAARSALAQNWPPFILVSGLLLIGAVADEDGLFAAAGLLLARVSRGGLPLFAGATVAIGLVTSLLNLDTSVAFLTPVFVYTARRANSAGAPLLYGSLLLSNAASLFLPGSNLTNLIVLGHFHLTGGQFFARMWAPASAAFLVTAAVIVVLERASLGRGGNDAAAADEPHLGVALAAVLLAAALVIVLRAPALPVLGVGVVVVVLRGKAAPHRVRATLDVLGLPVLVGLFGLAVALGTLGRVWSGPSDALVHLNAIGTTVVAAAASVVVNNLPAASLLGARTPPHPYTLLIGLNLGPNLFVTGSLSWLLWLRAARTAGARPSLKHASALGVVAVPLSLGAALAMLSLTAVR